MAKLEKAMDWLQVIVMPILAASVGYDWYTGQPATFIVWFWCFFGMLAAFFMSLRDLVLNDY